MQANCRHVAAAFNHVNDLCGHRAVLRRASLSPLRLCAACRCHGGKACSFPRPTTARLSPMCRDCAVVCDGRGKAHLKQRNLWRAIKYLPGVAASAGNVGQRVFDGFYLSAQRFENFACGTHRVGTLARRPKVATNSWIFICDSPVRRPYAESNELNYITVPTTPDTPAPAGRRIAPGCDRRPCSSSAGSWRARCRPSPRTACRDWAAWRRTSANPPSRRCRPIARA